MGGVMCVCDARELNPEEQKKRQQEQREREKQWEKEMREIRYGNTRKPNTQSDNDIQSIQDDRSNYKTITKKSIRKRNQMNESPDADSPRKQDEY